MAKAGRPPGITKLKLEEIDLDKLFELASKGLTMAQIANDLGIDRKTLFSYQEKSKEISSTLKKGREASIETLVNISYERAKDPENVGERLFWLKCRGGFREKADLDVHHHIKPIIIHKRDGSTIELRNEAREALDDDSVESPRLVGKSEDQDNA